MANRYQNINWGDQSDDSDYGDTTRLVAPGQSSYYQATQEHERGLDRLGEALKRQKNAANSLATEVDLHNEILDDIDQGLTSTTTNLQKNTRNIQLVMKKNSTFLLWLIIIILGVIIVIITLI